MFTRSPILSRMLMSAAVTVGVFALAEAGLRWADSGWSSLYSGDPHTHWWLKPDLDLPVVPYPEEDSTFAVRTNSLGLRDGELPKAEPWVLAVGCSTTFGWGVNAEDAWPEQLESLIGVEVINAGVPGHSTHQGLAFAEPLIARGPRVVIVGWGLRDSSRASRPDADQAPAPLLEQMQVVRTLRTLISPRNTAPKRTFRVSASDYAGSLAYAVKRIEAAGGTAVFLDMTAEEEHRQALHSVGPVVVTPQVNSSHRFGADPIHFNAEGNRVIAQQLAPVVSRLLSGESVPQPAQPEPQQTP